MAHERENVAAGDRTQDQKSFLQTGAVELKWKCANPTGTQGTIYECRRKIGNGAFTFVGATGVRAFTDDRNDVEMRSFDLLYGRD